MKRDMSLRLSHDPTSLPAGQVGIVILRGASRSFVFRPGKPGRAKRSRRTGIQLAGLSLAIAALALSPNPSFAQHGGGGGHMGGGRGHFGGGGHSGGGGHAGSAGGHGAASSPHVTPPHSTSESAPTHSSGGPAESSTSNSPAVTSPAHFVRPPSQARPGTGEPTSGVPLFAPPPAHTTIGFPRETGPIILQSSSGTAASAGYSTAHSSLRFGPSSGPLSFSGQGHQIWQDSPSSITSFDARAATSPASTLTKRPQPPHIIHPIVPPGHSPPVVFVPVFGFGFGPAFGWGCSPFDTWCGCNGFGSGWGYAPCYGYGYGGYYSVGWDNGAPSDNEETSNEPTPSTWQNPPEEQNSENAAASIPHTLIYLQDGTSYEVTDYWLSDNKLHYVTNYGGENSVDISRVDMQRTVDANAARGVEFTLHPAPPPQLTPPPSDDTAPPQP